MSEPPDSIKIKMLQDAGYAPTELQKKYVALVDFVKMILKKDHPYQPYIDAKQLLKQIDEIYPRENTNK